MRFLIYRIGLAALLLAPGTSVAKGAAGAEDATCREVPIKIESFKTKVNDDYRSPRLHHIRDFGFNITDHPRIKFGRGSVSYFDPTNVAIEFDKSRIFEFSFNDLQNSLGSIRMKLGGRCKFRVLENLPTTISKIIISGYDERFNWKLTSSSDLVSVKTFSRTAGVGSIIEELRGRLPIGGGQFVAQKSEVLLISQDQILASSLSVNFHGRTFWVFRKIDQSRFVLSMFAYDEN